MKAFQIKEYAHPSKIQVYAAGSYSADPSSTDVEVPKPNKREVLIDVHAAGLNFFEWVMHDSPTGVADGG